MSPPTFIPINLSRCKANSRSASAKVPLVYKKPKLPYRVCKKQPLFCTLIHTNSVRTHQVYLFKNLFNIVFLL